jgi:hypothetical protein
MSENTAISAPDSDLYKTEKIASIIKYAITSTYIKQQPNENPIAPLSVWLIAPPEHNKTRILLKFKKAPNTIILESLSSKPLNDLIREQDKKQTVHHIILLDFIRVLEHKSPVVNALVGTMLNLLDEGVSKSLFYGQELELKHRIQMGLITAITPSIFKRHFSNWNKLGTLTRCLIVSWQYSESTKNEIMEYIRKGLPAEIDDTIATIKRRGKQTVTINNPDIACAIKLLTEDLVKKLSTFSIRKHVGKSTYSEHFQIEGFRLQKMLRLLIKAIAYSRNRNEVNYEDLAELKELCDYIRMPDNPKEL